MMIKYRAALQAIRKIEIERETDKCVFFTDQFGEKRREAKRSEWQNWFDTWADAHAFLIDQTTKAVEYARLRLEQVKGRLENVKGLREES